MENDISKELENFNPLETFNNIDLTIPENEYKLDYTSLHEPLQKQHTKSKPSRKKSKSKSIHFVRADLKIIHENEDIIDKYTEIHGRTKVISLLSVVFVPFAFSTCNYHDGNTAISMPGLQKIYYDYKLLLRLAEDMGLYKIALKGKNFINGTGWMSSIVFLRESKPRFYYKSEFKKYIKNKKYLPKNITLEKVKTKKDLEEAILNSSINVLKSKPKPNDTMVKKSIDTNTDNNTVIDFSLLELENPKKILKNLKKLILKNETEVKDAENGIKKSKVVLYNAHCEYIKPNQYYEMLRLFKRISIAKKANKSEYLKAVEKKNEFILSIIGLYPDGRFLDLQKFYKKNIKPLTKVINRRRRLISSAKYCLNNIHEGNLIVKHNINTSMGRDYNTVANMPKEVRGIVLRGYSSLDITNMAPSILSFFAKSENIDCFYLDLYNDKRDKILRAIQAVNSLKKLEEDEYIEINGKELTLKIIFGDRQSPETYKMLKDIKNTDNDLYEVLEGIIKETKNIKNYISRNFNEMKNKYNIKFNKDDSLLSMLFMSFETTIMSKLSCLFEGSIRIHDEIQIPKEDITRNEYNQVIDILGEYNVYIKDLDTLVEGEEQKLMNNQIKRAKYIKDKVEDIHIGLEILNARLQIDVVSNTLNTNTSKTNDITPWYVLKMDDPYLL